MWAEWRSSLIFLAAFTLGSAAVVAWGLLGSNTFVGRSGVPEFLTGALPSAYHAVVNRGRRFQAACEREWKNHRRFWEGVAALLTIGAVALMAAKRWVMFGDPDPTFSTGPSVWDYLFGTQPALGAIRLVIVAASLFLVASLAAHLVAGRWIRRVGGSGLETDPSANDPGPDDLRRDRTEIEQLTRRVLTRYLNRL